MIISNENLRHTTREHHRPFRSYVLTPRGGLTKRIEKKMPTDNFVPTLWL